MPLLLRLLQSEQIIHSPQPANDIDQVHFLLRYKCKKDQGKRPQWLVDEIYNLVLVECTIHQTKDIERRAMFDRRAMSGRNSLFYSTPACFLLPPILLQSVLFYGTSSTLHAYSSQVDMATCTLFSLLSNTACTFFPLGCQIKLRSLQSIRLSTSTDCGAFGPRKASKVRGKTIQQRSEFFASLVPNASTSSLAHALVRSLHTCMCVYYSVSTQLWVAATLLLLPGASAGTHDSDRHLGLIVVTP